MRFGLRIGVSTGEVLASNEPGADLGMITGDAVNVAARLEQSAEPGQIVVAERTARQAHGFRFEDLGPLALKGKSMPVRAFLLAPESAGAVPVAAERGVAGLSAPMVGRDSELALLRAIVDRCESEGQPHLVTVYGEAGVGKSRLVRELVAWAEQQLEPPVVLRGRCLPYGDGVTYWPLAEILKGLAGVFDSDVTATVTAKLRALGDSLSLGDPDADVGRMVDGLAATMGFIEPGSSLGDMSPRQLRTEIRAAWRGLLTQLAATAGSVLVVVEDIHWGDPALLDLVEELAERCAGAVIIICPSRPDLTAHRPGWGGGRRNASAIALDPLSLSDARQLASLLLDIDDLPEVVRARILERAEGNPFFLEEILRQLIDEQRIVRDGNRWRAGTGCRRRAHPGFGAIRARGRSPAPGVEQAGAATRCGRRKSVLDGLARRASHRCPGRATRHPRGARPHHHQDRLCVPG